MDGCLAALRVSSGMGLFEQSCSPSDSSAAGEQPPRQVAKNRGGSGSRYTPSHELPLAGLRWAPGLLILDANRGQSSLAVVACGARGHHCMQSSW